MSNKNKKTSIGGQALIEGIMMRGPEYTAMAVRNSAGQIVLEKEPTSQNKPWYAKIPIVRGVYGMVSSLTTGYKYLMRSADIAMEDALEQQDESEQPKDEIQESVCDIENVSENEETKLQINGDTAKNVKSQIISTQNKELDGKKSDKQKKDSIILGIVSVVASVLAVILSIGLFVLIPTIIAALLVGGTARIFSWTMFDMDGLFVLTGSLQLIVKSVIEGVLKIAMLVLYMWAVSFMKDIRTTFMYHGAEHKTIFCYEQGLELTVENVRCQKRFHPRCGTSFMILMLLVSIFIGFFITFENVFLRSLVKILLLPPTVGIGYELIKFAGRHDNMLTRIISAPGVALQHITTKEPDDKMIECAIVAMNEVIPKDLEKDNW